MNDIKILSPYLLPYVIEWALDRNYKTMADIIEISGKYELDEESVDRVSCEIKECQKHIYNIQQVAHRYHVSSKQIQRG